VLNPPGGVKNASGRGPPAFGQPDAWGMKKNVVGGDPVLYFVVGRDPECWSLVSSVGVTFVAGLILAAATAAGIVNEALAVSVLVGVVAVVGWWSSPASAALAGLVGFLFANGFLLDTEGTLAWHGQSDLVRLTVMVCVAVVAALLGRLRDLGKQRDSARSRPLVRKAQDSPAGEWWTSNATPYRPDSRGGRGRG
jgi:hypothetical protein